MSKKVTAVEWLFEQLDVVDSSISYEYFKQAKAMEKQQMTEAWKEGYDLAINGERIPKL
jgi:hypothetical protein